MGSGLAVDIETRSWLLIRGAPLVGPWDWTEWLLHGSREVREDRKLR